MMHPSTIQKALLTLRATGCDGFEGFIRDAFQEAVAISLRLLKSGQQGGVDAISDLNPEYFSVGVEAKRYKQTTALGLGDLKIKLIDAATRTGAPIEVWVLVASKEISADDITALERLGTREGVSVVVLDWNSSSDKCLFSPLPLLLTLAPSTVQRHLGEDIAQQVTEIKDIDGYAAASKSLIKKLSQPDLGFESARINVGGKIAQALTSRADSKAKFKTPIDILDNNRLWTQRDSLSSQIDNWVSTAADIPVCSLIGEEGAGKTWLMFEWWRRFSNNPASPLILWISSRDIASLDLLDILSLSLNKWFPRGDNNIWTRRIALWMTVHTSVRNTPLIYLMIDGVNEGGADQTTLDALSQVVSSEWLGKVAILLSDRPDHWSQRMNEGASLEIPTKTIHVGCFTYTDLDTLLTLYNKSRDDFSADVLSLIRWPSWFQVAAELFDQKNDWSAHSPEQLMVRYWAHRLKEQGRITSVDPTMFQSFLREIGKQVSTDWDSEQKFKRKQLKEYLTNDTDSDEEGLRNAISDIVDGRWLHQTNTHEFTIKNSVLPCAAALALIEELKNTSTEEDIESLCEKFLGPIEDRDIGVAVLRSTVALTYMNSDFATYMRKALVKRWILARNFRNTDFQLLWRIGLCNVREFLSITEDVWHEVTSGSYTDEILIKSIVNIADDPDGLSQTLTFLKKWAGTYWLDPKEGQFLSYKPSDDERIKAQQITQGHLAKIKQYGPEIIQSVRCYEDGYAASWISHRVWAVSSYLPRAELIPVYRAWVLSRAIMDCANHYEDMAWTLRLNPVDSIETETSIRSLAKELYELGIPLISKTTNWLLKGLGSPAAIALLTDFGERITIKSQISHDYSVDKSGSLQIYKNNANDVYKIRVMSSFALNPSIQIRPDDQQLLAGYAEGFPVDEIGQGRSHTKADIDLEIAEPALARWAPNSLILLYHRYLSSISTRDERGLMGIGFDLAELSILFNEATQEIIEQLFIDRATQSKDTELDQISHQLWSCSLFGRTASDQQRIWHAIGAPASVPMDLKRVLTCPETYEVMNIEPYLSNASDTNKLTSWLGYLVCSGAKSIPEKWEPITRLFNHTDGIVRYLAFDIALQSEQLEFSKILRETDWSASEKCKWEENVAGSLLLIKAATLDDFKEIASRIEPFVLGELWEHLNFSNRAVNLYLEFLEDAIRLEIKPPNERKYSPFRYPQKEPLENLYKLYPDQIRDLTKQLFEQSQAILFTAGAWPRLDLLQLFFNKDPEFATELWSQLRKELWKQSSKNGSIDALIFEAPSSESVDDGRNSLLIEASNDWRLLELSRLINRYSCVDWAISWITSNLSNASTKCPGEVARAIILAGLLDDSEEVKALWNNELNTSPCDGWLDAVYNAARDRAVQGWHSLYWLQKAIDAVDDNDFFIAWRLFSHNVDLRLIPIATHRLSLAIDSMNRLRRDFIRMNYTKLENLAKKEKHVMEKELFFSRKGFSQAHPWSN